MTDSEFQSLRAGDVIRAVGDCVPYTVGRRFANGMLELHYPGPVRPRTGRAVSAKNWTLVKGRPATRPAQRT